MSLYCERCGTPLVSKMKDAKRHSRFDGEKLYYKYTYCPKGVSFLWLGHTAFYHGGYGGDSVYKQGGEGWADA